MSVYELVCIIRQDVPSTDVDKIVNSFTKIITENAGSVIKVEYWGLIALAYTIGNNTKGHYVLLGINASPIITTELKRKMKLSEDIIRFMFTKVDSISAESSPILKSKNTIDNDNNTVDVTISKDL